MFFLISPYWITLIILIYPAILLLAQRPWRWLTVGLLTATLLLSPSLFLCLAQDNAWLRSANVQRTLYIGPKDFGYNLNVFARTAPADRPRIQVRMKDKVILSNAFYAERIPAGQFVDLIALLSPDGRTMPAFTEDGNIISQDGKHLTRAGARYFGQRVFCAPPLSELWTVTTCRAVR